MGADWTGVDVQRPVTSRPSKDTLVEMVTEERERGGKKYIYLNLQLIKCRSQITITVPFASQQIINHVVYLHVDRSLEVYMHNSSLTYEHSTQVLTNIKRSNANLTESPAEGEESSVQKCVKQNLEIQSVLQTVEHYITAQVQHKQALQNHHLPDFLLNKSH